MDPVERAWMRRHIADLAALAQDPEVWNALAILQVADFEPAELFTTQAVVQEGRQNRAVAFSRERARRRRF
jgi:hypothetical protein